MIQPRKEWHTSQLLMNFFEWLKKLVEHYGKCAQLLDKYIYIYIYIYNSMCISWLKVIPVLVGPRIFQHSLICAEIIRRSVIIKNNSDLYWVLLIWQKFILNPSSLSLSTYIYIYMHLISSFKKEREYM